MTARAYVERSWAGYERIAVFLGDKMNDGRMLVGQPTEITYQTVDEGVAVQQPTLLLTDEMGRALLDALAAHFGGTSDAQTLRKDYMAERSRVDKMLDHLIRRAQ